MITLQIQEPKILVVGDLMIDHYLWGNCERISPEAPVQIVSIEKETSVLGGAGNVIRNLCTLGASVDVISVLGEDDNAKELQGLLEALCVSSEYMIVQKERITSKKSRILASGQQVLRYDKETKEEISFLQERQIISSFQRIVNNYDIIILSDYNKGLLTHTLTQALIKSANKHQVKIIIDPKGNDFSKYKGAYLLTPNKKEAILATGIDIKDTQSLYDAIEKIKISCALSLSLITLSEEGIAIYDEHLRTHPTVTREVFDVTGAGDTVIASLGFAIASGYEIDDAVKFANLCAGIVVGKVGSATVSLDEVIAYESSLHQSNSSSHIKSLEEITRLSQVLKKEKKKIVFTNGCFDILHIGHVKYLEEAKSYGDILIIGLNSDESVKRLKGESRPINTQDDRAYLLASLEAVDFVVCFEQDTPYSLIKAIQPHILVKGGDYEGKEVVGQEIADELRLVAFVEGKSTTKIIERIQNEHS
jgi:D-beta-D-heptose 7-phosphate kinase/D-beta-D-heptose 1-phosphate adenosyltransferase